MSDYAHQARVKLQEAIVLLVEDQDYELVAEVRKLFQKVRNDDPTGYYQELAESLEKANANWQESHRLLGLELEKTKAELKEVRLVSEGWEAAYNRARDGSNAHRSGKEAMIEKYNEQAKEVTRLENVNGEHAAETYKQKQQLKEYEATVFDLRNDVTGLTQENGELKDKHKVTQEHLKQVCDTRQAEVKKFEEHNTRIGNENAELREGSEFLKTANMQLEKQIDDWRAAEKAQREAKETWIEEIGELKEEIEERKESYTYLAKASAEGCETELLKRDVLEKKIARMEENVSKQITIRAEAETTTRQYAGFLADANEQLKQAEINLDLYRDKVREKNLEIDALHLRK